MNICVTDKVTQKTRSAPLHTLSISIKREYGDRFRNVEYGSFTPLVFSTFGGLGREFYVLLFWPSG